MKTFLQHSKEVDRQELERQMHHHFEMAQKSINMAQQLEMNGDFDGYRTFMAKHHHYQTQGDYLKNALQESFANDFLAMAKKRVPSAEIKSSEQRRKETDALMKQRQAAAANKPKQSSGGAGEKYPLGGYDAKSGRSYSEEVESVTEGGILKSIKRGLQGWGGDAPTPKELVRQNKGHSDDTIKALARDTRNINPHTPGGLQKRVVDREMKKRGLAQKGVKEEVSINEEHLLVAKSELKKHKDWMDSEGYDTKTKPLPVNHPKHKTHVQIEPNSTIEHSYHLDGYAVKEEVELGEVAAWQRKEGKNPSGGLNKKGIASYRRENPGSKLSMAVTTKPSKLKKGSKSWNRRKSFCARMGGMPGPMKDEKGRPTRKALSLRKWNC